MYVWLCCAHFSDTYEFRVIWICTHDRSHPICVFSETDRLLASSVSAFIEEVRNQDYEAHYLKE
jgi:hypothetical protein